MMTNHPEDSTTPRTLRRLLDTYRVEIPRIQRDYAQGRLDTRAKTVRERFVADIHTALKTGTPLELGFIYGQTDSHPRFVPVDGQHALGQADSFYMRLNARGKPFTPFENYKARLVKACPKALLLTQKQERGAGDASPPVTAKEFADRLDGEWSDYSWSRTRPTGDTSKTAYDVEFLNVITALRENLRLEAGESDGSGASGHGEDTFPGQLYDDIYLTLCFLAGIPNQPDDLSFPSARHPRASILSIANEAASAKITLKGRFLLYALVVLLRQNPHQKINEEDVGRWLRVWRNLATHSNLVEDKTSRLMGTIRAHAAQGASIEEILAADTPAEENTAART